MQDAQTLLDRALPFLERLLASQGDRAEAELIALQHEVAAALGAAKAKCQCPNSKGAECDAQGAMLTGVVTGFNARKQQVVISIRELLGTVEVPGAVEVFAAKQSELF